jgi:guanylate kinase
MACLFVICAPSGAGKTSLVKALLERVPDIRLSVSYTTRAPRPGEADGTHYHFVTLETFRALDARGEFLESAYVHGNHYATSKSWLDGELAAGHDVLLEIDWQGAAQVHRWRPESVTIFILPPSMEALAERLHARGQDSETVIARRLEAAREEIRHHSEFDFVIVNNRFESAVDDLVAVVRAARLRTREQTHRYRALLERLQ